MSDYLNWQTFIAFALGVWLSMWVKSLLGRAKSKVPAAA